MKLQLQEETILKTETLSIGGMHCASCSARVEKTLRGLQGVESAAVNLATEKATVVFDPGLLQLPAIKDAITGAGYEVRENEDNPEKKKS